MTRKEKERMKNAVALAVFRAGGVTALASLAGVAAKSIYRWRAGETDIDVDCARKVAECVGLSKSDFRPDIWPDG